MAYAKEVRITTKDGSRVRKTKLDMDKDANKTRIHPYQRTLKTNTIRDGRDEETRQKDRTGRGKELNIREAKGMFLGRRELSNHALPITPNRSTPPLSSRVPQSAAKKVRVERPHGMKRHKPRPDNDHSILVEKEDEKVDMTKIDPGDAPLLVDDAYTPAEEEVEIQRVAVRPRPRRRRNSIDCHFLVFDHDLSDDDDDDDEQDYPSSTSSGPENSDDDDDNDGDGNSDQNNSELVEDPATNLHINMEPKYAFNAHLLDTATRSKHLLARRISRSRHT